eukprot:jgi/Tetstr1/425339/TSEL_015788.t1
MAAPGWHLPLAVDAHTAGLVHRLSRACGLSAAQILDEALQEWARSRGLEEEAGDADWSAQLEWLPKVFGLLGEEAGQLGNARLVCHSWAAQALGSLQSLNPAWDTPSEQSVARVEGLLRHCTQLKELTVHMRGALWEELSEPEAVALLSAACSLPELQSLNIFAEQLGPAHLGALRPALPRLKSLRLATRAIKVSQAELTDAFGAMTAVARLDLDTSYKERDGSIKMPDYNAMYEHALAALPPSLTSLSLAGIRFGQGGLAKLVALPSLTSLELGMCRFSGSMGLAGASTLRSLTLGLDESREESDLEDILGLSSLRQLHIDMFYLPPHFTDRLANALPGLTSLSLLSYTVNDDALRPLGRLTGLTHLEVSCYWDAMAQWTGVIGDGLVHLSSLTQLQSLTMKSHNHPDFPVHLLELLRNLPALKSLHIQSMRIDDGMAARMPPQLEHLALLFCRLDHNTLAALATRCPRLISIDLGDEVSLQGLAQLGRLSCLQRIFLHPWSVLPVPLLPGVLGVLLRAAPDEVIEPRSWYHDNRMPVSPHVAATVVEQLSTILSNQAIPR